MEIVWRFRYCFLHRGPTQIISALRMLPICHFSSPKMCPTNKTQENFPKLFDRQTSKLNHQDVHSTLLNCPSDLIALRFFLWCAGQHNFFHNKIVIDHMVGVIKRVMEQYRTVKLVIRELESMGCVVKSQTFLLLLRIYWRGEMYTMVFEAIELMGTYGFTPNTFARNIIIDALFKIGHVNLAIKFLKETRRPNFLTFNIALCNLCNINDLYHIGDVFRMMLQWGYSPKVETFEMILSCLCKMGKIVEAHQVLGLLITLGIAVSVNVWSMLMNGFCRLQRLDVAGKLLEKMVETGSSPSIVTYTTLIRGFLKSNMVSEAFNILNIMESKGYAPDLVLCNVLIDSFAKAGRCDDAIDVFVSMRSRNLAPDSCTVSSLLSTLCLSRRFDMLPKLVRGLDIEADLLLCNSLLCYFCKAKFPSLAVKFYNDMLDNGLTPDKYTFVGLVDGLCKAKRVDEAVDSYHGILQSFPGQDAYIHTVVMDGLIKVRKFNAAIRVFRKAVEEGYTLDVAAYTVAIIGLFMGGRAGEAWSLYCQMKEVGLALTVHTYNVMVSGFVKERDLNMVNLMLQEMIEAKVELSSNTFLRLSKFLCRPYLSNSVIELWIEMRSLGLISSKVVQELLSEEVAEGMKVDDGLIAFSDVTSETDRFVETSGSEDVYDVAASMA
ncbi:putative pentatricopeptide repeat-containing protein At1g16830 isoform X4 [Malus sylvestris]|uniref:putative pentatricopeptide repeat-containing protein At1g16830 isoform X4 n=1 Tax=Malus sylvestris TaxID=3752 RepID=UPI0021AC03A2|nr:putative pentatricopeptide repeat-containing protein At1g16830 isoform X4 [Malus sylvestris]